jgi:hypothetical protein
MTNIIYMINVPACLLLIGFYIILSIIGFGLGWFLSWLFDGDLK